MNEQEQIAKCWLLEHGCSIEFSAENMAGVDFKAGLSEALGETTTNTIYPIEVKSVGNNQDEFKFKLSFIDEALKDKPNAMLLVIVDRRLKKVIRLFKITELKAVRV